MKKENNTSIDTRVENVLEFLSIYSPRRTMCKEDKMDYDKSRSLYEITAPNVLHFIESDRVSNQYFNKKGSDLQRHLKKHSFGTFCLFSDSVGLLHLGTSVSNIDEYIFKDIDSGKEIVGESVYSSTISKETIDNNEFDVCRFAFQDNLLYIIGLNLLVELNEDKTIKRAEVPEAVFGRD